MIRACIDIGSCGMNIDSPVFGPIPRCAEFSATPWGGSFGFIGGKKNGLRCLRSGSFRMVRPQAPSGTGQVMRRCPDLSGAGGPARSVPEMWDREAGEALLPGGQPVLHQAIRLLCRPALPERNHHRCRQGAAARLEHGQGAGDPVHEGAAPAISSAKAEGHRDR